MVFRACCFQRIFHLSISKRMNIFFLYPWQYYTFRRVTVKYTSSRIQNFGRAIFSVQCTSLSISSIWLPQTLQTGPFCGFRKVGPAFLCMVFDVGLQYILDKRIKRMKDRALSVKVELSHNNLTKGGHILHEQEYNTGHGVQAILNEIRGEIRRQPCQPEI